MCSITMRSQYAAVKLSPSAKTMASNSSCSSVPRDGSFSPQKDKSSLAHELEGVFVSLLSAKKVEGAIKTPTPEHRRLWCMSARGSEPIKA